MDDFQKILSRTHLPYIRELPGQQGIRAYRILGAPIGEQLYHMMIEIVFAGEDEMQQALASPEGRRFVKDLIGFGVNAVTITYMEEASL
ncbi:MAG: EthD family reductase [Chlorobi bacterium]|nr:EthD family reductase [Chlorobiota bacterium]